MVERRKIRKSGILDALIRYSDGTAISGKQVVVNYFSLLPAYRVGVPRLLDTAKGVHHPKTRNLRI